MFSSTVLAEMHKQAKEKLEAFPQNSNFSSQDMADEYKRSVDIETELRQQFMDAIERENEEVAKRREEKAEINAEIDSLVAGVMERTKRAKAEKTAADAAAIEKLRERLKEIRQQLQEPNLSNEEISRLKKEVTNLEIEQKALNKKLKKTIFEMSSKSEGFVLTGLPVVMPPVVAPIALNAAPASQPSPRTASTTSFDSKRETPTTENKSANTTTTGKTITKVELTEILKGYNTTGIFARLFSCVVSQDRSDIIRGLRTLEKNKNSTDKITQAEIEAVIQPNANVPGFSKMHNMHRLELFRGIQKANGTSTDAVLVNLRNRFKS